MCILYVTNASIFSVALDEQKANQETVTNISFALHVQSDFFIPHAWFVFFQQSYSSKNYVYQIPIECKHI